MTTPPPRPAGELAEGLCGPGMDSTPTQWSRPDGKLGGSIACGKVEGDLASVMWTNDSGPLLALAQGGSDVNVLPGPDVNALWRWWSSSVLHG